VILLLTIVVVRITSGDDVMDFVRDGSLEEWYYSPSATEDVSRFGEYRDIRIVPVWTAPFAVPPSLSRRGKPSIFTELTMVVAALLINLAHDHPGAKFTFTLPADLYWNATDDAVGNAYITFSSDQVCCVVLCVLRVACVCVCVCVECCVCCVVYFS
jgi:hypothetical protein